MRFWKGFALLTLAGALCLAIAGCAGAAESSAELSSVPETPMAYRLVTLGDSISYGFGLEDPPKQRYSAILAEKLTERDGAVWSDENYAVSGDDSTDLIGRLQDGRAVRLPSADVIVLNIGANNLLGVYTGYLRELVGNVDPATLSDEEYAALQQQLLDQMEHNAEAYSRLLDNLDAGIARLEKDLATVYDFIRERNDTAVIYAVNIYNPFINETDIPMPGTDEPFSEMASREITRLNAVISDFAAAHPDDVCEVDLRSRFEEFETPPILGATEEGLYLDPHPSAEGQRVIADLLFETLRGEDS